MAKSRDERGGGDAADGDDRLGVERGERGLKRNMHGHRHDAQLGRDQHHHGPHAACKLAQELGMAGMREARGVERLLLHRVGDERRGAARLRRD